MEWYWWVPIIFAVMVILVRRSRGSKQQDDAAAMLMIGSRRKPKRSMRPELASYLTALCKVYATNNRSLASPETRRIGQEIYEKHGHDAMVLVCDELRSVLGGPAARDLEYKWSGIGEWQG